MQTVTLDGRVYRIQPGSWRGRDVIDFAPRASVAGENIIHSELGLYQPLIQTDWRHGFGFHWYTSAAGYMRTEGNVDTRHEGIAMLFTKSVKSDTLTTGPRRGFVVFNGELYAWGDAATGVSGLRKFSGGTWSNVTNDVGSNFGNVNTCLATGSYLFVCPDNARIKKIDTSGTVTVAGVDSNATDFRWLAIGKGNVYAGKDGTNVVHYGSAQDLSDLHGSTDSDTQEIYVGFNGLKTLRAISYQGRLFIFKEDGLYVLSDDDKTAQRLIDLSDQISDANFQSVVEWNGELVFPIRDQLFRWNGSRLTPIPVPKITDSFPYVTYGLFKHLVRVGRFLFVVARTNETPYAEHLLCYDGVGWHKLTDLSVGSEVTAMGYDVANNRMWYHVSGDGTYYIQFQNQSELPYADFPTTGTHRLVSSRLHMGFAWVNKSSPSLVVRASNCTPARYIRVLYQLDGNGTWVEWGKVTKDGLTEFKLPGGNRTIEYDYMNLAFDFVTNDPTQSPILEEWTLRFMLRPNVLYGYVFDIVAGSDLIVGHSIDTRSAKEIIKDLKHARDSKAPIQLITPYGDELWGYITAINENAVEQHPDHEDNVEAIIRVNFISLESEPKKDLTF